MTLNLWAGLWAFASAAKGSRRLSNRKPRRRQPAGLLRVELLEVRALLSGGLTGAEPEVYLPGSLDSTPDGTVLLGQPGNSDRGGLDGPLTAGQSALTAKTSQQPDDYPLPPARGPKLRGDLEAQPAAMALLLPLNDSPQVLVPTLLT